MKRVAPPRGVRGLKSTLSILFPKPTPVAPPSRGAWIEMDYAKCFCAGYLRRTPLRGAWIEISPPLSITRASPRSHPLAGCVD